MAGQRLGAAQKTVISLFSTTLDKETPFIFIVRTAGAICSSEPWQTRHGCFIATAFIKRKDLPPGSFTISEKAHLVRAVGSLHKDHFVPQCGITSLPHEINVHRKPPS
jgi:hypothetical protein